MPSPDLYEAYRALTEAALAEALPEQGPPWPAEGLPQALSRAMRYSLLLPGKRLRPVLLLASHALLDKEVSPALPFAAAIEMIHCYSLIHDDLPAMDNDDLRRGKPTNHKVFGEAMAILAGDALLNTAYQIMGESDHPRALPALREIARRAGAQGMIAGQAADIFMENKTADREMLSYIHSHKTADLMIAPVAAGLILAGATAEQLAAGRQYAYHLGIAFQIVDDLLDVIGDAAVLGKATGKDEGRGKQTWPGLFGVAQGRADARTHVEEAIRALDHFGETAGFLCALASQMLNRVQ
ncbi:MAG: polyprenyl synthetase family protein [Christensenellales bacterium]